MTDIHKTYGTLLRNVPDVEQQSLRFIVGQVPDRRLNSIDLKKNFDGRIVWKDYLSTIKTQDQCGFCYACASVGSLSDRYAIMTLNQIHVDLSAADMVMCLTVDPKLSVQK